MQNFETILLTLGYAMQYWLWKQLRVLFAVHNLISILQYFHIFFCAFILNEFLNWNIWNFIYLNEVIKLLFKMNWFQWKRVKQKENLNEILEINIKLIVKQYCLYICTYTGCLKKNIQTLKFNTSLIIMKMK